MMDRLPLLDTHAHLDDEAFDMDREELIAQIGGLDFGFGDLLGKLRHGLIPLAGFLGGNGPLLPRLTGGLAGKAIRRGERKIIQLCLRIFHGWPGLSC